MTQVSMLHTGSLEHHPVKGSHTTKVGKETSRGKGSTSKQSQRRNMTRQNTQKCFEAIRMIALLDEVALLSYNAFVARRQA
jgi:hypothetical protein